MKEEIKKLVEKYGKLETELLKKLDELENSGTDCNCNCDIGQRELIKFVHEGNHFDEIISICLNCGGNVEN